MNESKNTAIKNSIGMFDLARGFLMFAVVTIHSVTMYWKYWEPQYMTAWWYPILILIKPVIYGVIPMFFIMSGYGFRKKPMGRCFKERARYLLKPYLFVTLLVTIFAVLQSIVNENSIKETLWQYTVPFLLGLCPGEVQMGNHYLGSIGPLWFLVVLFFGWIILNLIFQLKSEGCRALCLLVCMLLCTKLPFMSFIPYCLVQSCCGAMYFYIGYVIKKYGLLTGKLSKQNLTMLLMIACPIMLIGNVEVSQNVWTMGSLDFVASAIIGVLFLKLFCSFNRFQGFFSNILRVLGKNSLYILCIHTIEYLVFPWNMISQHFVDKKIVGILITFIVRSVMIATGCYLVQLYISKKRKSRVK